MFNIQKEMANLKLKAESIENESKVRERWKERENDKNAFEYVCVSERCIYVKCDYWIGEEDIMIISISFFKQTKIERWKSEGAKERMWILPRESVAVGLSFWIS